MRVRGNLEPDALSIAPYEPIKGKVEVRLRENVTTFEEINPETEEIILEGYEYDEYTFVLDDIKGLRGIIESDIDNWLITGRTLEVDTKATLYVTARADAVDEYTEELIEEGLL